MNARGSFVAGGVVVLGLAAAAFAGGFDETFVTDPIASGRWTVLDGDGGRFVYDSLSHTLTAHYDSGLPTARLVRPLDAPVSDLRSFVFRVEFEIRGAGFFARNDESAQIAFGMLNQAATGPDRAGGSPAGGNAYELVSWDYYPNPNAWCWPSMAATVLNRDMGTGYFGRLSFPFGAESCLSTPGEGSLPLDTPLTATVAYRAASRQAVVTVAAAMPLTINVEGQGGPGGPDGDPYTLQTANTTPQPGFTVDAFGLLLWQDTWVDYSTTIADVVYRRVTVELGNVRPDFDDDGDVDGADFGVFTGCFNGTGNPVASTCVAADLNGDGFVDGIDFGVFSGCFNGSGNAPACG